MVSIRLVRAAFWSWLRWLTFCIFACTSRILNGILHFVLYRFFMQTATTNSDSLFTNWLAYVNVCIWRSDSGIKEVFNLAKFNYRKKYVLQFCREIQRMLFWHSSLNGLLWNYIWIWALFVHRCEYDIASVKSQFFCRVFSNKLANVYHSLNIC